jgi:hypothetical protein
MLRDEPISRQVSGGAAPAAYLTALQAPCRAVPDACISNMPV